MCVWGSYVTLCFLSLNLWGGRNPIICLSDNKGQIDYSGDS